MKRLVVGWLVFVMVAMASLGYADTKIDPFLNLMPKEPAEAVSFNVIKAREFEGKLFVDVLIRATNIDEVSKAILDLGGKVSAKLTSIIAATIPFDAIEELAGLESVTYIEAAKRLNPKMNYARSYSHVDDVQTGSGIEVAYNGSGVIVGAVDSGINCTHADFLDSSGNSRILYYWDQTRDIDYKGTSSRCGNSEDEEAHGTHVTGIAAGSDSTYKGVAPEANIIMVMASSTDADSGGTFSTSIISGIQYIFKKAQELTKPAVVNLSLGSSLGAHDGTSNLERGLEELLSGKQGRAIVNAAGNENFPPADSGSATLGGIHATVNLDGSQDRGYEFVIRYGLDGTDYVMNIYGGLQVDLWLNSGGSCTAEVDGFSSATDKTANAPVVDMTPVAAGSSDTASNAEITIALDFTDNNNANNGKQHAAVLITRKINTVNVADNYSFDLVLRGTCVGDAWIYPDQTVLTDFSKNRDGVNSYDASYKYTAGDSQKTMTVPGTANSVITAGSFMGRATWVDINGTTHYQTATSGPDYTDYGASGGAEGDISVFSSLGPTADGRTKPDIAAPGEPIISTLASNISVGSAIKGDATHFKLEGTSMSSPHVAGTVALLLNRSGCLTPTEIKDAINNGAQADSFTGAGLVLTPDNTWGHGKLDALAALNSVSASSCQPNNSSEDSYTAGPSRHDWDDDGGETKSSCLSVPGSKFEIGAGIGLLCVLFTFVVILWRRGKVRG